MIVREDTELVRSDVAGQTVRLEEIRDDAAATFLVDWTGDDDAAAGLLARLVDAGVAVRSFADVGSDLEDLFLQLTAAQPGVAG